MTVIAPGAETRMEKIRGGTIAWVKSPHLPFDRNYRMFWHAAGLADAGPTARPIWWKARRPGAAAGWRRAGRARR